MYEWWKTFVVSYEVFFRNSLSSRRNPLRLTQKLDSLSSYPLPEDLKENDQNSPEHEDILTILHTSDSSAVDPMQLYNNSDQFLAQQSSQRFHSLDRERLPSAMLLAQSASFPRKLSALGGLHNRQSDSILPLANRSKSDFL